MKKAGSIHGVMICLELEAHPQLPLAGKNFEVRRNTFELIVSSLCSSLRQFQIYNA